MKRLNSLCFALILLAAQLVGAPPQPRPAGAAKPKLVLALMIDQFRADYLTRFRSDYNAGLARLIEKGAWFTNAHYEHFPTVTAVGHSVLLSGAMPSISGIVGNEWFDREAGKQVTSVSDSETKLLGVAGRTGSSPRRMLVSTIGDELKMAGRRTRVIGISSKDRSAVLPAGRMSDGSYWFDAGAGNFVSSTYYFPDLPQWVKDFNESRAADKFLGKAWTAPGETKPFRTMPAQPGKAYYDAVERSPFGNEILVMLAERAVEMEKLGQHEDTDILALSLSANDRIGHAVGPDSPEVRDVSIQTDRLMGRFLSFLDQKIGLDKVLIVMTADHGVAPLPEVMRDRKMPGGRMSEDAVQKAIDTRLTEKYGPAKWVVGHSGPAPYLDHALIRAKGLDLTQVQDVAAEAARATPHIARVYTATQLQHGEILNDLVGRRVSNGFHPDRTSDLFIVPEPYWLFEDAGTSHGTPYNYDSHVPVIFFGAAVKPGRYRERIMVNDIATTLAAILDIPAPSGAMGRVLSEILTD